MLLYLDTSALVKRYVAEENSEDVSALIDEAPAIVTSLLTQTEVAAALGKAVREKRLTVEEGRNAHAEFLGEWPDFGRVPVTNALVTRADSLVWDHGLRAYDAVQLAAALKCQETVAALGYNVVFACCDKRLRKAAREIGLSTWPEEDAERAGG